MVYIHSTTFKVRAWHFDTASAMYGCIEQAIDYRMVTIEEVQSGKMDNLIKANLFVGSVEFMTAVWSRIDVKPNTPYNSNAETQVMSLKEAKELVLNDQILFIKPSQVKLFSGSIVDKYWLSTLNPYPDDTEVFVRKQFDSSIQSEWRCYIHNRKVVHSCNYSGNHQVIPNWEFVNTLANTLTEFPISYTIDVAVLENNQTVIVELQDMWAIGNYGVPNDLYLRLLRERYFEIVLRRNCFNVIQKQ